MLRVKSIYKKYGENICRRCINTEYHVALVPDDCQYFLYPQKCNCCGDMRNIVAGLRLSGRRKLLLR